MGEELGPVTQLMTLFHLTTIFTSLQYENLFTGITVPPKSHQIMALGSKSKTLTSITSISNLDMAFLNSETMYLPHICPSHNYENRDTVTTTNTPIRKGEERKIFSTVL